MSDLILSQLRTYLTLPPDIVNIAFSYSAVPFLPPTEEDIKITESVKDKMEIYKYEESKLQNNSMFKKVSNFLEVGRVELPLEFRLKEVYHKQSSTSETIYIASSLADHYMIFVIDHIRSSVAIYYANSLRDIYIYGLYCENFLNSKVGNIRLSCPFVDVDDYGYRYMGIEEFKNRNINYYHKMILWMINDGDNLAWNRYSFIRGDIKRETNNFIDSFNNRSGASKVHGGNGGGGEDVDEMESKYQITTGKEVKGLDMLIDGYVGSEMKQEIKESATQKETWESRIKNGEIFPLLENSRVYCKFVKNESYKYHYIFRLQDGSWMTYCNHSVVDEERFVFYPGLCSLLYTFSLGYLDHSQTALANGIFKVN